MNQSYLSISGMDVPVTSLDTVVIGSGCAGYNAADWLFALGREDVAMVTEGVRMGASRNTGSDKQTYYKLSLASDGEDSVRSLAKTLHAGGCVHGDTALCEAAGSVRGFMKLVNLGVPFPTNAYGEYIGYKTDHDPRRRATSAGPLTSKFMTEALEKAVRQKGIPVFDGMTAVRLLVHEGAIAGVLCLDRNRLSDATRGLHLFAAHRVVLATGGPAACYHASVYPESQTGMAGLAIEAGAQMANLQEWQYGLASIGFRWNVSGTYQQALPRYIAVDDQGVEHEFLPDMLGDPIDAMNRVFLKGYQWPFDVAKVEGSSLIDILVHHQTQALGRRVYMDFRRNPTGLPEGFDKLSGEAHEYLQKSGALFGTPIERLAHMNPDAIALYKNNGIDLYTEPLEIAVCAQHHNGGIAVDNDWQTCIRGLYAVGEAAGTFGVYRPGGSALNATQVGSLRAAESIAWDTKSQEAMPDGFEKAANDAASLLRAGFDSALTNDASRPISHAVLDDAQRRMSDIAAHVREESGMQSLYAQLTAQLDAYYSNVRAEDAKGLAALEKARDALISQRAVLSAMLLSAKEHGSHGSALVLDSAGELPFPALEGYRYRPKTDRSMDEVLCTQAAGHAPASTLLPARPMPVADDWFETEWAKYRERRNG